MEAAYEQKTPSRQTLLNPGHTKTMSQHLSSYKKLTRIRSKHNTSDSQDFLFSAADALRIRQLIAYSLVVFFAKLYGKKIPDIPPVPAEFSEQKKVRKHARK